MRKFEQLSPEEQEQAESKARDSLLQAITEGAIRFNDELNTDDLQARIDSAGAKAEQMQTPWFAHEYIYEAAKEEIDGMARCDAEDALYPDPSESIIRL